MLARAKRWVTRNKGLKTLSLLMAILVWFLAAGQERTEVAFLIPVELLNVPETVAIQGSPIEFVHVRLRGSRGAAQRISSQEVRASLDLKGLKPGDNFMAITQRNIQIPREVELVSVTPPYIYIEAAARKLIPVKVKLRGKPAEGYTVGKVTSIPSNIFIIGEPLKVDQVSEIDTYPINIKGATSSVLVRADLVTPDPEVRLMELRPTEVSVSIDPKTIERRLKEIPVVLPEEAAFEITPPSVSVRVSGPYPDVTALDPQAVVVTLTPPDPEKKTTTATVQVTLPPGISLVEVSPPEVTLAEKKP